MKKRLQYINLLRIYATLAIVITHTSIMFSSSKGLQFPDGDFILYNIICRLHKFAVPIFLLISGALLLKPEKKLTYHDMLHKYMPRIIRVLLIFGFAMCLAEAFMIRSADETPLQVFLLSAKNLLTGHCWEHMWYMYMLLGLYALTPVYKAFIDNATKRDSVIFMVLLGIMCVVLPYLKNYHLIPSLQHYLMLPVYLFVYPCGYYINEYFKPNKYTITLAVCMLAVFFLRAVYHSYHGIEAFHGYDPYAVFAAVSIFHLSRLIRTESSSVMDKLSKHTFCIYIVHAAVLNVLFKFLHVETIVNIHPLVNYITIAIVAFLTSWLISIVLRQIPYLRDKIL